MGLSFWQILIILGVLLIIFGPSRIPGLGRSLGQAIRGFKKGLDEDVPEETEKKITSPKSSKENPSNPPPLDSDKKNLNL